MAEPGSLIFPATEYAARRDVLQAAMARAGLHALLLTLPADIFYVTGFLTRFWESPARPWFVVLPRTGDPIAVIPEIGAALMARTWVQDIRSWDAPDPVDDGVSLLADTLADCTPDGGKIGTPMGLETHLRMPLADLTRLTDRLGSRILADATAVLHRAREVKSPAEIAKITESCAIAHRAFSALPGLVHSGLTQRALFSRFQIALLDAGADWVSYLAGGAGPEGYGDVISPADDTELALGDVLMLDTGAVRDGYFCDFDRNFALGQASEGMRAAHRALYRATDEVLTTLRPGGRACDVHAAFARALTAQGYAMPGGRVGHGLGVTLTEWPSFTDRDQTVLRAGMVLTLEPSVITAPGRMMTHEENIVLEEDGPRLLSPRAAPELPVIPV